MDITRHRARRQSAGDRTTPRPGRPELPFWIMAGFVALLFLAGGSSREDVPLMPLLRPVAILLAAYGLATLPRERWRAGRLPLMLAGAVIALVLVHLFPLPPAVWHALPGHGGVRAIDAAAGLGDVWRPMSLMPSRTINAFFFLFVPLAAFLIAVRLTAVDRVRLLCVILSLGALSAFVGLLQSAGVAVSLYHGAGPTGRVDAAGVFANQNHQAALLAIMLPMLAVVARSLAPRDRTRLFATLAGCFAAALVVLLIVTGSRAGLVLGVVAIALALFYGLVRVDRLERMPPRRALLVRLAIAAAVIGVAAAVTIFASRDLAFSRLAMAGDDLRPRLWASILPILPQYQPWGSGIGSYVEVYRANEPAALLRSTYSNHAHNEYLEVLMTAGLPGLALVLVAALLLAGAAVRHRRGSGDAIQARLGVTIAVILAAASVTDYPLRTPLLAAILALAAAWCCTPAPPRAAAGRGA